MKRLKNRFRSVLLANVSMWANGDSRRFRPVRVFEVVRDVTHLLLDEPGQNIFHHRTDRKLRVTAEPRRVHTHLHLLPTGNNTALPVRLFFFFFFFFFFLFFL